MMERRKNLNDKFGFVEIMEYTSIGESCSVVSGGTPSRSKNEYWENGNIPWIKIGNIKSKYVNEYDELITEQGLNNSSAKLLKKGTILYTIFATLGEVGILDIEACTNQAIAGINITDPRIKTDYLYYYLKSKKDYINNIGRGVAQNNINLTTLKNFEIPLIDVNKQLNIVEILEKVERMICLKEKEIDDLDLLIKARFVEMFGNPVLNDKEWKQEPLRKLATKIGSGATPKGGKDTYRKEGISFIRSMNVHNGQFEYKDLAHISYEQATQLDNVTIEPNDVLLNITGASVARCCIVPADILPARVNQHVCIVRCNDSIMAKFLNYLLIDNNCQDLLWNIAGSGATREAITKQQIENLPIILPPFELQQQFEGFVEQVDKSRFDIKKSIIELEREVVYD